MENLKERILAYTHKGGQIHHQSEKNIKRLTKASMEIKSIFLLFF